MADIGTAIRKYLIGRSAIAAIAGERIYPDALPQGATLPAAVYYVISGDEEIALDGRVPVTHARIQVDAYAETRQEANELAEAIRDELAGLRGTADTVAVAGVSVAGGERWDTQPLPGGDERQYITSRDFLVSFQDA